MGEMHEASDAQLLRDYAEHGHEAAFRDLVTRHTDLVYSAALRQVYSPDLAGDIAQSVFTDLARKARPLAEKLPDAGSLAGWLHRGTRYAALSYLRDTRCRLANERQAMEQLLTNSESAPDWERIRPVLDEALDSLGDEDREALLLRYFKNHDFRAVGLALGVSDDAAQKRVSRAVESLREFFVKRGVTVGASGLVALLAANAVQAAPAGLAATISGAAALVGTSLATAASASATKAIVMTTLQKTLITTTIALAFGTGIYQARQASTLRTQVQTLQQQQGPLTNQVQELERQHDEAKSRLVALADAVSNVKGSSAELLKLRAEVARLRGEASQANDPFVQTALTWKAKRERLQQLFEERPGQRIAEMQLLSDQQWLDVAKDGELESETGIRKALSHARQVAKNTFAQSAAAAVQAHIQANDGRFPTDLSQLQPYFKAPMDDAILQRYEILPADSVKNVKLGGQWVITEKAPVDPDYDSRWSIGPGSSGCAGFPSDVDGLLAQLAPAIKA